MILYDELAFRQMWCVDKGWPLAGMGAYDTTIFNNTFDRRAVVKWSPALDLKDLSGITP